VRSVDSKGPFIGPNGRRSVLVGLGELPYEECAFWCGWPIRYGPQQALDLRLARFFVQDELESLERENLGCL
jgi:hypothetical protein